MTSFYLNKVITTRTALSLAAIIIFACQTSLTSAQSSYYLFESGHVRPMAMSADGSTLFAVNTPDNRLEVYSVDTSGLTYLASVPVGMEPVAVAVRNSNEVWVVNHLSDSVSVVDVSNSPMRVSNTLLVGDEPRDLVFAGTGNGRAFITTAHRGQHRLDASLGSVPGAGDPQLTTPGIGRADVWIFNASNLATDTAVGGVPLGIVNFFADTPRALTVSPDGNTVYVAAFKSGNQTATISEQSVCDDFQTSGGSNCGAGAPGGVAGPVGNVAGVPAPETGLIVKFNGNDWVDTLGRDWSSLVSFNLPDSDVFSFNANATSTLDFNLVSYSGVGTVLFNMAVNPSTGKVYVSNVDAQNHIRFEGAGDHGGSTVQGHIAETRITVIDPVAVSVSPKRVNKHIDYSKLHTANDPLIDADIAAMRPHTLSTPMQIETSADGNTIYMAAFGSSKIAVFSTADIEDPNFATNFDPATASANYISTTGGPSGFVLDEARNKMYVMQRFDHSIAEIDLSTGITGATHLLVDAEPSDITEGRKFLYDGTISSGNGESSCASCHIFGDMDDVAWNLGDPDGQVSATNNQPSPINGVAVPFHPMKGPMMTQTLRGISTHGAMHWRGDRVDGFFGADPCTPFPGSGCDEAFSFNNFIVAFEGLLGKDGTPSVSEMQQFTDFILQLVMPPNPVANLDGTLTTAQSNASSVYFNNVTDIVATCNGCHVLDPANGFFGSGGFETFEAEPQNMKVAHLRNSYQKVGAFGASHLGGPGGDQMRGFGYLHDGALGSLQDFISVFQLDTQVGPGATADMVELMLAFPTDLPPIAGQQVTLTSANAAVAGPRIDLLRARANIINPAEKFTSLILGGVTNECDLVVKGNVGVVPKGWLMQSDGSYINDTGASITDIDLRALSITDGPLTFTCAVPGSGQRMAIDRDEDTVFDGIDNCVALENLVQLNFDGDTEGDACDADDDNDTLSDLEEIALGTNTLDTDTDDDGFDDAIEVAAGSNPLSAASTPESINIPMLPGVASLMLIIGLTYLGRKRYATRSQ